MRENVQNKEARRIDRIGKLIAKGLMRCAQETPPKIAQNIGKEISNTDPILSLFESHHELSISEIKALAGLTTSTAHRKIKIHLNSGKLMAKGEARATRYCIRMNNS